MKSVHSYLARSVHPILALTNIQKNHRRKVFFIPFSYGFPVFITLLYLLKIGVFRGIYLLIVLYLS